MKICSKPSEIRGAIRRIKPSHIAVAFIGKSWHVYINHTYLQEIIVSTMPGSNPRAIEDMMGTLGHENVHFLDNLHSKVYLGECAAFIGSANLSNNALSDFGHHELGTEVTSEVAVKKVRNIYNSYLREARELYPTKASKVRKLEEMYAQWQKTISSEVDIEQDNEEAPSIAKLSSLDQIHIAWHTGEGGEYNQDIVYEIVPEASGKPLESFFSESTHFLESDDIQEGHWIILWRCNSAGLPRAQGDVQWVYVDKVISNGVIGDEPYTKLAAQVRTSHRKTEPFLLDAKTKEAIRKTLKLKPFAPLRADGDAPWSMSRADTVRDEFLKVLFRLKC